MATVIAYVDGFNLYHGLHDKYRRRYLWLDLERLVQRIRPRDQLLAVRYFTAMVRDDKPALARQLAVGNQPLKQPILALLQGLRGVKTRRKPN